MKKSQLLKVIDKVINEVLTEATTYAGKGSADDIQKDPKYNTLSSTGKLDVQNKLKTGTTVTLDESRKYGIADNEKAQALINASNGKAKVRIQQIIDAINDSGGRLSGGGIARALGIIQPQINNLLRIMTEHGILDIEGGREFATTPEFTVTPDGESEEGDEESEYSNDEQDLFVGSGGDRSLEPYFKNKPEDEPKISKNVTTKSTNISPVGEWLVNHSTLIQAIINKYKTLAKRTSKLKEGDEIGLGDINKSTIASRDWAKESLVTLIDTLVAELFKIKQEKPELLEKILFNLKKYKFEPTGTGKAYKEIIKKLGEKEIDIDSIDNSDLELDDEDDLPFGDDELLDEPIMERFKKLAKLR